MKETTRKKIDAVLFIFFTLACIVGGTVCYMTAYLLHSYNISTIAYYFTNVVLSIYVAIGTAMFIKANETNEPEKIVETIDVEEY